MTTVICAPKRNNFNNGIDEMISKLKSEPFFNELDFAIQECEIRKAICCLKNGKSAGLDGINNEMIKLSQNVFLPLYTKMFNKILNTGTFPNVWSKGYITPLHKSGTASDPDNYRGIMINSCLSKVFTSIINNRLYKFFAEKGIINDLQIGFMKDSQTSDHMLVLKTLIDEYITNKKGGLYFCFVDFRKAYDSVWREGLFYKLLKAGVRGNAFNVIESMYRKSECCVKINGERTDFMSDSVGVKQGEVLSPLLFNLFINDLIENIQNTDSPVLNNREMPCLLYADDLVLMSPTAEGLQCKLDILDNYCKRWMMEVNPSKTKVMRVTKGGRTTNLNFLLGDKILENTNSYKYLGTIFSSSGNFTAARKNMHDRGLKALFSLKAAIDRNDLTPFTSLKLFDNTVKQVCLYGAEIWGNFDKKTACPINFMSNNFSKLPIEKINISFCKWLLGVNKNATNLAVLGELGRYPLFVDAILKMLNYWLSLQARRNTKSLINDCLKVSETLHERGTKSWITGIHNILSIFDENYTGHLPSKINISNIKSNIKDEFKKFWKKQITSLHGKNGGNKLRTYSKFKGQFSQESYVTQIPFSRRANYTKFRISAHTLAIETGRHTRPVTPVENRLCRNCELQETEDEFHALLRCTLYKDKRKEAFDAIDILCNNFNILSEEDKLIYLFNSEDNILDICVEFINHIMNNRRSS